MPFGILTSRNFWPFTIVDAPVWPIVIALAFGLQWVLSGHGAFVAPVDAPDFGLPDRPRRRKGRQES